MRRSFVPTATGANESHQGARLSRREGDRSLSGRESAPDISAVGRSAAFGRNRHDGHEQGSSAALEVTAVNTTIVHPRARHLLWLVVAGALALSLWGIDWG